MTSVISSTVASHFAGHLLFGSSGNCDALLSVSEACTSLYKRDLSHPCVVPLLSLYCPTLESATEEWHVNCPHIKSATMRTSASAANFTRLHAHNAASTDQNISSLKNIAHPPWSVIKSQKEKARVLIRALSQLEYYWRILLGPSRLLRIMLQTQPKTPGRISENRFSHHPTGRPIDAMDAFLAATAEVHQLTLVTRTVSDFRLLKGVLNPWMRDCTPHKL